jgi:hypothetical protein
VTHHESDLEMTPPALSSPGIPAGCCSGLQPRTVIRIALVAQRSIGNVCMSFVGFS